MAFANLVMLEAASSSYRSFRDTSAVLNDDLRRIAPLSGLTVALSPLLVAPRRCFVSSCLMVRVRCKCRSPSRWRLNASTLRAVDQTVNGQSSHLAGVEIPVTCYQLIGVPDKAEKDEIVKSVMELRDAEVEDGYTMEAVVARKDLLMDVRDKLLFEPEYAGSTREKIPPKSSLRITWAWLPGALCLLQEVGEEKLVLDIGRAALQYPDSKPYIHDLLLSMALAECAIAKIYFEKNTISQGFEALARAQCLLRSKVSLGKMKLLSQIEESLEELAPACTLELLGTPHTPDNTERRRGALAALRELLRQGLDVESSCQVHDWPCFLSQALSKLMAVEIVDLLPWDSLASTRKNKKSVESHNQRVIIDFDCFHTVLIAYIALGFSSRQPDLISKARTICECLIASEGIDLKFEEAFCLFLLGQGTEAEALVKLQKLELSTSSASQSTIFGKEHKDVTSAEPSLENWLKVAVLGLFSDTKDCSPSLGKYFGCDKRVIGVKQSKGSTQVPHGINSRPPSPTLLSERRVPDERHLSLGSSRYLGPAVKQLASSNFQSPLPEANAKERNSNSFSSQLKRELGAYHDKTVMSWLIPRHILESLMLAAVLGCIFWASCKLLALPFTRLSGRQWTNNATIWTVESLPSGHSGHSSLNRNVFDCVSGLLSKFTMRLGSPAPVGRQKSLVAASLSSPLHSLFRSSMPIDEAESLVRQWQAIKAEVLGPDYRSELLYDVLEEPMLLQWQGLADAAKTKSCFWRFVLLQLSVLRADILSDNVNPERAEIEVLLEEAAELVDETQPKNPTYYSTYKINYLLEKQDDGSWKFYNADIHPQT
ncbi:hypothetical protein V2J09_016732 [Rumex salicifolius]